MPPKKTQSLSPEIKEYVSDFADKLKERHLEHFWVLCDRADFKTHKDMLFRDMEEMFQERKSHYRGKKVAEFNVVVDTDFDTPSKVEKSLINIRMRILTISEDGRMQIDEKNSWVTTPIFYEADLKEQKVTIKLMERLMRAVAQRYVVGPAFGGITYRHFVQKLAQKGFTLEDMDPKSKE